MRIAFPAIVANVTIPLLGLLDTAIAGHLGSPSYIGAVAVGAIMFNMVYFSFGFLRMSTSGLTAQHYGGDNHRASVSVLKDASIVAITMGVMVIALQWPLQRVLLAIISPSPAVCELAQQYFYVCAWGAPPVLMMMAIKGWLLGMQDSKSAMKISIIVNVINTVVSLLCVYVMDMGFMGIAVGTLVSEYLGLGYSVLLLCRKFPRHMHMLVDLGWKVNISPRFFTVSGDIFMRSFLLTLVHLAVVSIGARSGDVLLAVNSLIQQLNTFFAYFLDGIAFAGEAIVGKYYGARNVIRVKQCVRHLFVWATALTVVFMAVYAFPHVIFSYLTSESTVINVSLDYRWWCALLPLAGMAAFVWDGVFIGLTHSRGMLMAVGIATVMFFVVYQLLPQLMGNHRLWLAFIAYLAMRGIVQSFLYLKILKMGDFR